MKVKQESYDPSAGGLTDAEKARIIAERKKESGVLSLLGMASKAGRVAAGTDRVCDEIRRHGVPDGDPGDDRTAIVILSSDASANTSKRVKNACKYYGIRLRESEFDSVTIGERTGNPPCAVVAVFDGHFADGIIKYLDAGN